MDPNRDPRKVQSLKEEMAVMGLNPGRTLNAMTRGCELLDEGSHPMDLSGLPAGSEDVPRTIAQVGRTLREDADVSSALPKTEAEIEEAFKMVRKLIKTAAEKMGARRAYRKVKSKARRYAKQYYKRSKRKISKTKKRLRARFGGEAGLKKARAGGKKRIQRAGLDIVSTLREELEQAEAVLAESQVKVTQGIKSTEAPLSPFEEAAIKAGLVLMHVGECFEDVQVDVAAAIFNLSDAAADLAEAIEGAEEVTEEQEQQLEQLFLATVKALKAYESIGSPSLMMVYEGIEYLEDAFGGNLVEKKWIQQAIKQPGRVREYLGVKKDEDVPETKIDAAIEKLKTKKDKSKDDVSMLRALVLAKRFQKPISKEDVDINDTVTVHEALEAVFVDLGAERPEVFVEWLLSNAGGVTFDILEDDGGDGLDDEDGAVGETESE